MGNASLTSTVKRARGFTTEFTEDTEEEEIDDLVVEEG